MIKTLTLQLRLLHVWSQVRRRSTRLLRKLLNNLRLSRCHGELKTLWICLDAIMAYLQLHGGLLVSLHLVLLFAEILLDWWSTLKEVIGLMVR